MPNLFVIKLNKTVALGKLLLCGPRSPLRHMFFAHEQVQSSLKTMHITFWLCFVKQFFLEATLFDRLKFCQEKMKTHSKTLEEMVQIQSNFTLKKYFKAGFQVTILRPN
jgi:hypothetical protein